MQSIANLTSGIDEPNSQTTFQLSDQAKVFQLSDRQIDDINEVINTITAKFVFGYNTRDDMRQKAWECAMLRLPKWDGQRSLKAFMYTAIRGLLINYKRDTYYKPTSPCKTCPFYGGADRCNLVLSGNIDTKMDCSKYNQWITNNATRKHLTYFAPLEAAAPEQSPPHYNENDFNEFLGAISGRLEPDELYSLDQFFMGASMPTGLAFKLKPIMAQYY